MFEIIRDHADCDVDEWQSIECPLKEGVHCIHHNHGDDIFDSPQWVAVKKDGQIWKASLANSEGEAFDLLLGDPASLECLKLDRNGEFFLK